MCSLLHYVNAYRCSKTRYTRLFGRFSPRINGYIVNCIQKNTKVAENFVLRCLAASDPEKVWNIVIDFDL